MDGGSVVVSVVSVVLKIVSDNWNSNGRLPVLFPVKA